MAVKCRNPVLLALLALAISLSHVPLADAAKKVKLKTETIKAPSICPTKAKDDDKVQIHYKASSRDLKSVYAVIDPHEPPLELVVGSADNVEGLNMGMVGMCIGEKRRISVPPHKNSVGSKKPLTPPNRHLVLEVTMDTINGVSLLDVEAKEKLTTQTMAAYEQEKAYQESMEGTVESMLGAEKRELEGELEQELASLQTDAADGLFCDACTTFVEEFAGMWVSETRMQLARRKLTPAEAMKASIEFDDELQAATERFCEDQTASRITKPFLQPQIRDLCHLFLSDHRKAIVESFLFNEVAGSVPDRLDDVCAKAANVCSGGAYSAVLQGKCDFCLAAVHDLAFELRRRQPPQAHLHHYVYDLMENTVCSMIGTRHYASKAISEVCIDVFEDHGKKIVDKVVAEGLFGRRAEMQYGFEDIMKSTCVEANMCKKEWFDEVKSANQSNKAAETKKSEL